jgi:uncharacterized protein GlcG (DUF336 family)
MARQAKSTRKLDFKETTMLSRRFPYQGAIAVAALMLAAGLTSAQTANPSDDKNTCSSLPGYTTLKNALVAAITGANTGQNGGLNNQMWGTIVDRTGHVCAVAFTGTNQGAQWPGSRVISAQKANTANAFSLDSSSYSNGVGQQHGLALSTANLYSAVQPGGSLFGLQESNPVDTLVAYSGNSAANGTANDAMVGEKIGGINVFGGGLALYAPGDVIVGGVGVSGDTSCTDHEVAWRVRNTLKLDHLGSVNGVSGDPTHPDNIIYDIAANPYGGTGISTSGYGHPSCSNPANQNLLPPVEP